MLAVRENFVFESVFVQTSCLLCIISVRRELPMNEVVDEHGQNDSEHLRLI